LHGIEDRIEEWRGRMSACEAELQAHREMLLAEAAERERLLAQAAGEKEDRERSLEEAVKEHRVAFIVHSEDAGKALEEFAGEGARLVSLVPGDRSGQRGADIKGSWLVFE
jgi:predicted LPLAT superfamily acyltransferase